MISNPTAPNPNKLMAQLRMMPDQQLVQYAQMHKNDPYIFPMAFQESNTRKKMRAAQNAQTPPEPKVVDQNLQEMAQPMPEDQGIATLPAQNMQNMAGGGIVAFDDGGEVPGYRTGGTPEDEYSEEFNRAYKRLLKVEGGYVANDAGMGPTMYGVNWSANKDTLKKLGYTEDTVKNLTPKDAKQIYKRDYWDAIGGDKLAKKDFNFANVAFDGAANQGVPTIKPMLAKAGNDPYKLLELRQQRYEDLATPKENDTPAQAARRKEHQRNIEGWRNRTAALKTELDANQNNQRLPGITPGAQATAATPPVNAGTDPAINQTPGQGGRTQAQADALFKKQMQDVKKVFNNSAPPPDAQKVATGSEATQPDLDSSKAGIISSGLASLGTALPAVYEAFTPSFKPGTTVPQALGRTAATAGPLAALGLTGGAITSGATNALSNATPEQLDQMEGFGGDPSGTSFAAAIMNAPNRPPEKPPMSYGDQMANIAKTIVSAPDRPRKPEIAPEPEPEIPQGGMPDLNQAFRKFEIEQQNKAEDVQVAKPEITPEAVAAAPKAEATGGMDMNKLMMQMGLQLMAGKSPNALANIGEAGLGVLSMQQAEEKAKSEREAKMSEAEYRKAIAGQARAETAAIERGSKEKNNVALAEKAAQDAVDTWAKNNKMALLQSPDLYEQIRNKYRMEAYRSFGITPTMAAGAPTGGAKFLGFENPA
jgi:hypothetical protein